MPRVLKAGQMPEDGRIRALSSVIGQAGATKSTPTKPQDTALGQVRIPQVEPHSAHVSADSLERTQRLLCDVVAGFGRQRNQLLQQLQPCIVKLVMVVAREVVGRELIVDDSVVSRVVERALAELGGEGRIIVRVCPEDAVTLRQALDDGKWTAPVRRDLEIVADVSVGRGGCVLDSDYGQIDATIEAQVAELTRLLTNNDSACE